MQKRRDKCSKITESVLSKITKTCQLTGSLNPTHNRQWCLLTHHRNWLNISISISIYFHISQVNLHITEIRYNKIITCFECTSQNNFLTQDINGQCEYKCSSTESSKKYDGAYIKASLLSCRSRWNWFVVNITENGSKCNDQTTIAQLHNFNTFGWNYNRT